MEDLKTVEEYLKSVDPFDIPLDKYRELVYNKEYSRVANRIIVERLHKLHGDLIKKGFKKAGAQSIVLCGGRVVYSSKKRYEPSDEEIRRMEEEMGKPCFVVTGEPLIEERSSWSYLDVEDYYPTIETYVGGIDWKDEDVFEKGVKVVCDFDTGNPEYMVLDEEVCRSVVEEVPIRRIGYHLGIPYSYYPRSMRIGVTDGIRKRCLDKIVEGVDSWQDIESNPYRIANPKREGFVGRDLMLKLFLKITLDPLSKESAWELQ